MTHLPLASRLASLIGLPSNPSKYDGNDDDYIPYTGTFEPPPASSSRHAYAHAHTLSGSTQAAPSSTYSLSTTHPHPYNPAHSMVLTSPQTATSIATAVEEQLDRGRKRKSRPISTNSSFGPMSPLTATDYHTAPLPKTPVAHPLYNPASLGRKGGPSYLSLDGGFIGQSPVAAVPPREQRDRDRDRDMREAAKMEKHEKSAYRTSFASFMTFGG
ncbi:1439_t:CDS:1, partial [Acaulospora colombiana]